VTPAAKGAKRDDAMVKDFPPGSVKVVVAGGETGQPIAQAWQFNPPTMVNVDSWR